MLLLLSKKQPSPTISLLYPKTTLAHVKATSQRACLLTKISSEYHMCTAEVNESHQLQYIVDIVC